MMPAREVLDENRTNWRGSLNSRLATHCLGALLDKGFIFVVFLDVEILYLYVLRLK